MKTVKLVLATVSICALLGTSMNAYAKFGFLNGDRGSLIGAVKGRLSNCSTPASRTQRTPTKTARSGPSIRTKAPAAFGTAKAKLAGFTKRFSSGSRPKGAMRGARDGLVDELVFMTGMSLMVGGAVGGGVSAVTAADAASFMHAVTLGGATFAGGVGTWLGAMAVYRISDAIREYKDRKYEYY